MEPKKIAKKQGRHGDLLLTKKEPGFEEGTIEVPDNVLAHGESTHRHEAVGGKVKQMMAPMKQVMIVEEPTELQHLTQEGTRAEHDTITYPEGVWEVRRPREYNPVTEEERRVFD
jgi:hypothetical protein